jgi:hypothetical protein
LHDNVRLLKIQPDPDILFSCPLVDEGSNCHVFQRQANIDGGYNLLVVCPARHIPSDHIANFGNTFGTGLKQAVRFELIELVQIIGAKKIGFNKNIRLYVGV